MRQSNHWSPQMGYEQEMTLALNGFSELFQTLDVDNNKRGRQFEEICRWYLLNDPVYRAQLEEVYFWDDWPGRWGPDAGIDLVAKTKDGQLWAIQAKGYNSDYSIKKSDIDSFMSESSRPEFSYRLLIASTDKVGDKAERTMNAQEKPVGQVLLHDLERAELDWPSSINDLRPAEDVPKTPRPHQQCAIDDVLAGFSESDRGQLIMACGTGKTLISLWIMESLEASCTLVLVPSLSLLKQTIPDWLRNRSHDFEFLPVCSDETVGHQDSAMSSVSELGFPTTTDANVIAEFLERPGRRVVFSTYHSSPVIARAMKTSEISFELALADEAHRCAGPVSSAFATILDGNQIRAERCLFMTATPRYFTERVRKAGIEEDFEIASMDDDQRFGHVFHRLSFGEAIEQDLLSDYQVLIIGIDDETYRAYAENGRFVTRDGKEVTDARSLAAQIGLAKAIHKCDLRRILSFHGRVKASKEFSDSLPDVISWMPKEDRPTGVTWADHVSGAMNSSQRETRLRRLRIVKSGERGLLSNARCLSEGIDVPTLDGVAFIDPKRSEVDIIQAVGRAIRKADNKTLGTIVIPVFVASDVDPEVALEQSAFQPIWGVLRALRSHDEKLGEELDEIRREMGHRGSHSLHIPSKIDIDMPEMVGVEFSRAFETKLIEGTTSNWEHYFGLLEQYVSREGNARVPKRYVEDDFPLGSWIMRQRTAFKKDTLSIERRKRLEALSGWQWDPFTVQWEEGFRLLEQYLSREGNASVPRGHVEDDFKLGHWIRRQRTVFNKNQLSAERRKRLEALSEWEWDPFTAQWEERFRFLEQYLSREGNASVPLGQVEADFKLATWIKTQRTAFMKDHLSEERRKRLEALSGWQWVPFTAHWEEGFRFLEQYLSREGNARVPQGHVEDDFKLATWIKTQRKAFMKDHLSEERRKRLEALSGWQWDSHAAQWEEGFRFLDQYLSREGNARVPKRYVEDDYRLGYWVVSQRTAFKKDNLSEERRKRLEALSGWEWDSLAAQWEDGFRFLEQYLSREGNARVPVGHVEADYRLGFWAMSQRTAFKKDKLSEERRKRLEALSGWGWDSLAAQWEDGFRFLEQYLSREGNARVPQGHVEDDYRLGYWVATQRTAFKNDNLSEERRKRLEAFPAWEW
jgi:superfamily II DNA or RNA helicase